MSLSSVAKRRPTHPPSPRVASPKRTRTRTSPSDHLQALADLESQVHDLGAKVLAFRHKGLPFFARLSQALVQRPSEGTTDTAPTESKNAHEDLRRILKERLALANSMLPTLLEELVMWNTKIQQAVDVKRKDQRLPFP
ncbi:hypothetical protein M758_7G177300 [Ceratodon purpureus]|uniref:Uncharacterized protein n=1 Tax=Ceratodon purpureus TaxID=3225 RepID=A0A8T0H7U9_CERPU|nr:hypothetical protein KC19_7G179900 [Ceratodon purpureus]KAG0611928.1 hypothetical protein M758_7G177300 [Ceratodon purpureus]